MEKTILLYDLKNKNATEKSNISRKLFGYSDKSNHGKYNYQRKGMISNIKYEKFEKSAIIINSKDEQTFKKALTKLGLKVLTIRLNQTKH